MQILSVGLENVYFRNGITQNSSDVIRNEDYFYTQEDVLNNLRVNYGLLAMLPSIDASKDDDSIGVVGRLRRTTRPALSTSAEKENKKPLKSKRKVSEQSSPASSVGTSTSYRQGKRVKTSNSSSSASEAEGL